MINEIKELWKKFTNKNWININEYSFKEEDKLNQSTKSNNETKLNNNTINPSVAVTGALEGSILEGFGDGSLGGIIKLHWSDDNSDKELVKEEKNKRFLDKRIFSSCNKIVSGILNNSDLKLKFLNQLDQEQFIGLSNQEKIENLIKFSDKYPNHRDIGGNDKHWRIQVIRLPNKMVEDIHIEFGDNSNFIINKIINKDYPYWCIHDLVSLHTNSGNMSSTKQLMTFRRSAWRVSNTLINNKFNGIIINIEDKGDIYVIEDISYKTKNNITFNQDNKLGIKVKSCNKFKKDIYYLIKKILKIPKEKVIDDILKLDKIDSLLGTGVYKSLIQKLIRFQPKFCLLPDLSKIKSDIVLIYCMYKILISPPQYLPSLHRSVPGVENLTKRLGVIAFEDSDPTIIKNIHHLFAAALLSQRIPTWFPSKKLILKWFKIAIKLQESNNAIKYKTDKDNCIILDNWNTINDFKKSSMLIRTIGSFEGDMRMIEYQAINIEKINTSMNQRPELMEYPQHSFDQHVKPNIVLFFPDDLKYSESKNIFGGRVNDMFKNVTSINPRRTQEWNNFSKNSFVKMVQKAQNNYYKLLNPPILEKVESTTKDYCFKITDEWIAGSLGVFLLGKISVNRKGVKISCNMTASLNPFNINQIIVTPKVSVRGNINNVQHAFDQDMQEAAIKEASSLLEKGKLRLNKISKNNLPFDIYNWLIKKDKKFKFKLSKDGKKWIELDKIKNYNIKFPIDTSKELNLDINDLTLPDKYCKIYSDDILIKFINNFDIKIKRRALSYIKHSKPLFKMATVSRDGSTSEGSEQISINDSGAFKFFLVLSKLIPYAIRPSENHPFEFKVENTLLLKHLRKLIESTIKINNNYHDIWYSDRKYEDSYNRELFSFQEESIDRIFNDFKNNKTRHFINIKVGLGKTLIVLTYLLKRKLNDIKYIIYTMPKSAYGSVIDEISAMGYNINIYLSSKSIDKIWKKSLEKISKRKGNKILVKAYEKDTVFQEGVFNIIEHDGLRKYKKSLLDIISESILIIDEVHKCLPIGTKRSSTALEISKLAKETIAFTGTPIINSQGAKTLINWLEASVDFHLNLNNFGVATNSMISYSIKTDVKVKNINVSCNLNDKEKTLYSTYIKKKDLNNIVNICYQACSRKMIEITKNKLEKNIKVFLVAKNKSHQIELANKLSDYNYKIVCIGFNKDNKKINKNCDVKSYINLTDKSVEVDKQKDYDIVITRQSFSTGYNLTRMTCMITSVYFSSEPTREQLRGRINRLDQNNKEIEYITVLTGILELIHNNYGKVQLVSRCLHSKNIDEKDKLKLKKLLSNNN